MAKEPQELKWIESLLPEGDFRRRSMFGGFSYSLNDKMILALFESPGSKAYKGKKYAFELWDGCMFPVEREFHEKAFDQFPFLVNHPILSKWLYLPTATEGFEDLVTEVLAQVVRPTSFWGSIPGTKKTKAKRIKEEKIDLKMDTRKPRMFSDEPVDDVLEKAKKVSDLKNIGPTMEAELKSAGIKDAATFIRLGWQASLKKVVAKNPKYRHSIAAYTFIGALTNTEWNRIPEEKKTEARDFVKSLPKPKKK
jgi:hypothetical protein